MSDIPLPTESEMAELFGGRVEPVTPDADELAIDHALRTIRALLIETAAQQKVGNNELARRLDISPSAVSRMLRGEGDMRVSTAVLRARALGKVWDLRLRDVVSTRQGANFHLDKATTSQTRTTALVRDTDGTLISVAAA